jgi:predicted amidohydrolase YtcJ
MKKIIFALCCLIGLIAVVWFIQAKIIDSLREADTIFINADVYTLDSSKEWVEAVAIKGNEIVFVGQTKEALSLAGYGTDIYDLGGRMVLPGFVESHIHPLIAGIIGQGLWLADAESVEEYQVKLAEYAKANPDLDVITGFGWKPFYFTDGPDKKLLDEVVDDRPVILMEISGHSAWVNSKALAMANIDRQTLDPQEGFSYFARDAEQVPTGWVVELAAIGVLMESFDHIGIRFVLKGAEEFLEAFSEEGITTVFDAGFPFLGGADVQRNGYRIYRWLEWFGNLPVRVVGSFYAKDPNIDNVEEFNKLAELVDDSRLVSHKFLKINVDGDPASHSIGLYLPYADKAELGSTIFTSEELDELVEKAFSEGIFLHFHAMGDRSVGMVLTALEKARVIYPNSESRASFAHGYLIAPNDIVRLADLDVITSFAGNWLGPDKADLDAVDRLLGSDRFDAWYPLGSLVKAGVRVSLGSDFPVSGDITTYSMLEQIQYSMTRQLLDGGNVFPPVDQRIDLKTAIQAATLNGAYMLGMEKLIGSIELGKKADLIVLDKNLFEVDSSKVSNVEVSLTMVDGQVKHITPALEKLLNER